MIEWKNNQNKSMINYDTFAPARYCADLGTALLKGKSDLDSIVKWLGGNKDQLILEVGSGGGNLLLALREQGYFRCHGIDIDEKLVRHGREILGVNLSLGSWRPYLENSQETYDVIIALDVFEHLTREEIMATLQVTRARLAPGGRFIMRTPNALCPLALPILYGDLTHQFLITPRTLKHMLRSAGFQGIILILETRPMSKLKRTLFAILHYLIVKPFWGLLYYHFHGEFPSHITPNIICCAYHK